MDMFILRHGEAGKRISPGSNDFDRPLTIEGKREVADIAKSLKDIGVKFNFIITSPLKRAHETASIVAMIFNKENVMENWGELKPNVHVDRELYRKLSQKFKQDSSILIVGHEPYLSSLISEIISEDVTSHVVLKKAGLAKIRITSMSTRSMHGELEWLLTPKLMKNISPHYGNPQKSSMTGNEN
jgi:phosphohistidine phosphatase